VSTPAGVENPPKVLNGQKIVISDLCHSSFTEPDILKLGMETGPVTHRAFDFHKREISYQ